MNKLILVLIALLLLLLIGPHITGNIVAEPNNLSPLIYHFEPTALAPKDIFTVGDGDSIIYGNYKILFANVYEGYLVFEIDPSDSYDIANKNRPKQIDLDDDGRADLELILIRSVPEEDKVKIIISTLTFGKQELGFLSIIDIISQHYQGKVTFMELISTIGDYYKYYSSG